jgi:hypothetical protein
MARMRMYDITWHDNYMEVNIPENKTDINRRANYVIIGKTGNTLCQISLVMGSFLFIDWANIRLPPSKISVKKLSEQGLIFRENVCCTIVP